MYIEKIFLSDYRNYEKQAVSLGPKLNVICGKNASGKTNLLEAMYLLGVGRSPRTTRDKELIRWDRECAYVSAGTVKKYGSSSLEFLIGPGGKRIAVDGLPIGKLGELMGVCPVVFFSPDELKLVKDAPVERRRFMDISLSQQSKTYYYTLSKYNKILAQRNKLLKTGQALADTLPIWDEQLAATGAKLREFRLKFIEQLQPYALEAHRRLTGGEDLTIGYENEEGETEASAIKEGLLKKLIATREKDMRLFFTGVGPHRDDLRLTANGIDVKRFGSQGQQRTVSLALKLAEVELFNENTGEYPVLLLDDVLSELDDVRKMRLLQAASHIQTVITCTEFNFPRGDAVVMEVSDGTVKRL